jgi:hypothetical protein
VHNFTTLISSSFPNISLSTTVNFHVILGESSWIWTTSPTFMFWVFLPNVLWYSHSEVKYSFFHLVPNFWIISHLVRRRRFKFTCVYGSVSYMFLMSSCGYGRQVNLRPQRRWDGVNGSSSFRSDDTQIIGLSFNVASISVIIVCKCLYMNTVTSQHFLQTNFRKSDHAFPKSAISRCSSRNKFPYCTILVKFFL